MKNYCSLFLLNLKVLICCLLLLLSPCVAESLSSSDCHNCFNQKPSATDHSSVSNHQNDPHSIKSHDNVQCQNVATQTISTYDFDCEQLDFCDDRLGFEAILHLHRQLDEDANGDIDISESDEFIRDELKYENGAERHRAFHGNDKHITVDELWRAWRLSSVHNWTVDETVEWLTNIVELPKYQEAFESHGINGMTLPRLAANPQIFSTLGINNPIHKQKIALKATDVVLFGVPKPRSTQKDLFLGILFVLISVVAWYFYYQQQYSKENIRKMMKDMEALANAEKQLETLQMELYKTKQEHEEAFKEKRDLERKLKENEQYINSDSCSGITSLSDPDGKCIRQLEEELRNTKLELQRVDQAYQSRQWIPSRALQPYLQLTYEIETKYYNAKKAAAELQLQAAREGCDKLKKKRSSMFGAFRMAHSSSIDYVDNTIIQARTLLTELTAEMHERIKRWKKIESYCCFEIIHNPGLASLEKQLYGGSIFNNPTPQIANSTSSNSLSTMLHRRGSEATLVDDDTMSHMSAPGYSVMQLWQNYQIPNSLPIKRMPSSVYNSSSLQTSPMSPTVEESFDSNGNFYIGEDQQSISSGRIKKKSTNANPKANQFSDHKGSSDGVEKHFEELNQFCSSQSDPNIFDLSYMVKPRTSTNSTSVLSDSNEINENDSTITLNDQSNRKDQTQNDESNEETFSSSSNDSTLTVNTSNGDLVSNSQNDKQTKNKKRGFFVIRKRKSKSGKE